MKIFASRLKKVLPNLISSQQISYVAQQFIHESGRLISDLLSVTKKVKVRGYLVTIDIEKLLIHSIILFWLVLDNKLIKLISLQCSWIKKLYDGSFQEWKIIPLTLIKNTFRECFTFHCNLEFSFSLNLFPEFYIKIFLIHGKTLLLFSHLLQAVSDLSFCGLIKILKLITNHCIFRISRKRILILLNIYASCLEFLKAGVK